jgi:hypothetical protein
MSRQKHGERAMGRGAQGVGPSPFTQVLKYLIKFIKTRNEDCTNNFVSAGI